MKQPDSTSVVPEATLNHQDQARKMCWDYCGASLRSVSKTLDWLSCMYGNSYNLVFGPAVNLPKCHTYREQDRPRS
jgi:hypothetical protein